MLKATVGGAATRGFCGGACHELVSSRLQRLRQITKSETLVPEPATKQGLGLHEGTTRGPSVRRRIQSGL